MTRKPLVTTAEIATDILNKKHPVIAKQGLCDAKLEAQRKFEEWQEKYRPIEEAIYAERDRRERRKRINQGKAFGDLCEITEGRAAFCRRTGISEEDVVWIFRRRRALHPSLELPIFIGEMTWLVANTIRKELTRRIDRAKHNMLRPAYYEKERNRRLALAAERRKVKTRHTINPCPTKEQILDAWIEAGESKEAMLRFGSLLEDLECYVDNSLLRDGRVIIGRRPGIKGWLRLNIPALYLKYSTVMAYKAAAKKMRQVIGLSDPMPLSVIMNAVSGDEFIDKAGDSNKETRCGTVSEEPNVQDYSADETYKNGMTASAHGDAKSRLSNYPQCNSNKNHTQGPQCANAENLCVAQHSASIDKEAVNTENPELKDIKILKAKALYDEVMNLIAPGKRKRTELLCRLHGLTDPNSIADVNMLKGWKEFYENNITVRTKSIWSRKLWRFRDRRKTAGSKLR